MTHDTKKLLEDVRLAAQDIEEFTRGKSMADYQEDRVLRAAVERMFIIIGGALARLEQLDANSAGQITDLRHVIGFRNSLVHGEEKLDGQTVWKSIQDQVPGLKQDVQRLTAQLAGP